MLKERNQQLAKNHVLQLALKNEFLLDKKIPWHCESVRGFFFVIGAIETIETIGAIGTIETIGTIEAIETI